MIHTFLIETVFFYVFWSFMFCVTSVRNNLTGKFKIRNCASLPTQILGNFRMSPSDISDSFVFVFVLSFRLCHSVFFVVWNCLFWALKLMLLNTLTHTAFLLNSIHLYYGNWCLMFFSPFVWEYGWLEISQTAILKSAPARTCFHEMYILAKRSPDFLFQLVWA